MKGEGNYHVIVYFHGGALIAGSKEMGKDIGEKLAKNGIGFVSANYRLSPTAKYPDHLNDAQTATDWTFNNIEPLGGDLKNIYVCGHSAGAYLAAVLALNKDLKIHKMRKIKGAILISPFLYVEETAPARIKRDTIYKSIWGTNPEDWEKASVSPHIDGNNERFISIMAENDAVWRKEQNKRLNPILYSWQQFMGGPIGAKSESIGVKLAEKNVNERTFADCSWGFFSICHYITSFYLLRSQ